MKEYLNQAVLGPKRLVFDEIGYLPFGRDEANLFFNVGAKRYERGSMVLTSRLPCVPARALRSGLRHLLEQLRNEALRSRPRPRLRRPGLDSESIVVTAGHWEAPSAAWRP